MVGIEVVLESHIAQVVPLLEETCSHHPTHIECQEEKLKDDERVPFTFCPSHTFVAHTFGGWPESINSNSVSFNEINPNNILNGLGSHPKSYPQR